MICPRCHEFLPVVSSWKTRDGEIQHRKRVCENCGYEVVTTEIPVEEYKANKKLIKSLQNIVKEWLANTKQSDNTA